MAAHFLIGVDVGSSFVKAALFDENGRALGDAHYANHLRQPRPGVAEYDGVAMLRAILDALRELLVRIQVDPGLIAALSLDGMQNGSRVTLLAQHPFRLE